MCCIYLVSTYVGCCFGFIVGYYCYDNIGGISDCIYMKLFGIEFLFFVEREVILKSNYKSFKGCYKNVYLFLRGSLGFYLY